MTYLEIIVIGYIFNIFITIILGFKFAYDRIDLNSINHSKEELKLLRNKIIRNDGYPLRCKDYVQFLPFGYGIYMIPLLFNSAQDNKRFLDNEISEQFDFFNKKLKDMEKIK